MDYVFNRSTFILSSFNGIFWSAFLCFLYLKKRFWRKTTPEKYLFFPLKIAKYNQFFIQEQKVLVEAKGYAESAFWDENIFKMS